MPSPIEPALAAKEVTRIARLQRDAAQLRGWLAQHPEERRGAKGAIRKSNRTDNESAKMATGKGVIQGYTGVAAVDGKHQIIVEAQAHGTGSEQELLVPLVAAMKDLLVDDSVITADAGYHSEANLQKIAAMKIAALMADNGMRQRDERFATQDRHKQTSDPLYDKAQTEKKATTYQPSDFTYDAAAKTCVCPAGKSLYRHGRGDYQRLRGRALPRRAARRTLGLVGRVRRASVSLTISVAPKLGATGAEATGSKASIVHFADCHAMVRAPRINPRVPSSGT